MEISEYITNSFFNMNLFKEAGEYAVDTLERSIIYVDTLRKRGNIYFQHLIDEQPPVLTFDYEVIMDGKDLERPSNYSLLKIIGRRKDPKSGNEISSDRREIKDNTFDVKTDPKKRPIVIIDPRAGHGPGIGGAKEDSEIGVALAHGHPVYFIIFSMNPVPGQTLFDVQKSKITFLEKIAELHPEAEKPSVIGNCQAGWASAILAAHRPDVVGPMVFSGSPLSYWAGVEGQYPMRYKGGLTGGAWTASLFSDLGNGKFDGANLVAGFEDLNPANTLWKKQYNLYSHIDTEEDRYLEFERWWNGFFYMTSEEISFIISNLFVGNRLEQGILEIDDNKIINLKNIKTPIIVFASSGDNITPPQQALNWIYKVWHTVDELKKDKKVVVYLLHETIGHLGIFVSGKVSRKEHKEIIGSIDLVDYLSPGLYEMVIIEGENKAVNGDFEVSFEEREMEDILSLDDGLSDEIKFETVETVSRLNDKFYKKYVRPWVKLYSNEYTAEYIRQLHPLRWKKYMFSDISPVLYPFKIMSPLIKEKRHKAPDNNTFRKLEKETSDKITESLNKYRDLRDSSLESLFRSVYTNPFVKLFYDNMENFLGDKKIPDDVDLKDEIQPEENTQKKDFTKGGFAKGTLRLMVAMAGADHVYTKEELNKIRDLVLHYNLLSNTSEPELKKKLKEQAILLQNDYVKAINALPDLIQGPENRLVAITIAELFVNSNAKLQKESTMLLKKIKKLLDDKKTL